MSQASRITLTELLDQVESLAPLPAVASRVMQVVEEDRFSAYDLAAVIATDTALTAKILRLANSAFYGYPRRIATVRDGVVLIGFRAVRSTAVAAAIVEMFPPSGHGPFQVDLFWGHSVACGLVAEIMARETGYARPDQAFTAGILHDIGRLLLSQYQPDGFGQALYRALQDGAPLEEAERIQFGFDHSLLGARLAERWNFPGELCQAIQHHHDLAHAMDRSGLTYVVAHANALCHQHGLWCGLDSDVGTQVPTVAREMDESLPLYGQVLARAGGMAEIERRTIAFLRSAREKDLQWYSGSAHAAGPSAPSHPPGLDAAGGAAEGPA